MDHGNKVIPSLTISRNTLKSFVKFCDKKIMFILKLENINSRSFMLKLQALDDKILMPPLHKQNSDSVFSYYEIRFDQSSSTKTCLWVNAFSNFFIVSIKTFYYDLSKLQ